MADTVRGYHLTKEQLDEICRQGGLPTGACDIRVFDCKCDVFLHNEGVNAEFALDGAYDLARYLSRNPQQMDILKFTQLFCKKSQQVALLSHNMYPDGLREHMDTWELIRILFCDFFGDFSIARQPDPPKRSYLPDDETCRETMESLTRLPSDSPRVQLLCRSLHWLEHVARRSDWHDEKYSDLVTSFPKDCKFAALFDPDSKPAAYKETRVDFSEAVFYALRRGDPRFAAQMLLKSKEYWFSSFIRLCAPTFFNLPYELDPRQALPDSPPFLPKDVPCVHANASHKFLVQRKYFEQEADKDNRDLALPRHDILQCASSAPQLLDGLELLRGLKTELADDKSFMQKVLSALTDSNVTSAADLQLSHHDFLWKKLRAAWVSIVEAKLRGESIDRDLFSNLTTECEKKLKLNAEGDSNATFWQNIQAYLLCAALSPSSEDYLKALMGFVVDFVHRHKKTSSDVGASQELAFCANFSVFLNAAIRIRNYQKMPQPPIFLDVSKKFTGMHPATSMSLQKLVFSGQVLGGCAPYGNFYASHSIANSLEDPKLWQKLGLMIACCGDEPEETCIQRFCDSVIDHSDIAKLRKWQHAWVNSKRDHFDPLLLTAALTASAAGSDDRTIHTEFGAFKHRARDMYTQIGLEHDGSEKRRLLVQLAKYTLEWARVELLKAPKHLLLECLKRKVYDDDLCGGRIFTPFVEPGDGDYGHWSFSDMGEISLSDVAELYGLFKAAEVTDIIKIVSDRSGELKQGDPATCSVVISDWLVRLQRCFQECFWPPLSDGDVALSAGEASKYPFYMMRRGLWNEWTAAGPVISFSIIPRLVEDVLGCCSTLRQITLDQLAHAVAPVDQQSMQSIAALFRKVHDTLYASFAPACKHSALLHFPHLMSFRQSVTIDLADRSCVKRSNVMFHLNRQAVRPPCEVLFNDDNHDILRHLMAFAAEDWDRPDEHDAL